MVDNSFFREPTEQSKVKASIVSKYFEAWSKVIKTRSGRLAYVDLFAGPGRYEDGTPSTPVLILERALKDDDLQSRLITVFNDYDPANTQTLWKVIGSLSDIGKLSHTPIILTRDVGSELMAHVKKLVGYSVPTLYFVDPWGYKGLSLDLINSAIRGWGCDCIFFFNYVRINAGLANPVLTIEQQMDDLFGKQRADELRKEVHSLGPRRREEVVVEQIKLALSGNATRHVLTFRFKKGIEGRTSHHLIFVTKHLLGETIMKEILAGESSAELQGVASFEYDPSGVHQGDLFARPIDDLGGMLLKDFAGRELTMVELFQEHNVGQPYVEKNYREALRKLEAAGLITTDPPHEERRIRNGVVSFPRNVKIRFPNARL